MSNCLVTGGAGFIGSHIVDRLLEEGHSVRILDNFTTGNRSNVGLFKESKNFEIIEGDLRSFHIVRAATRDMDYVFHEGALPSAYRSIQDPITTNDVNILGTLNVLEAAKEFHVRRVVFASSSSVYGENPTMPKLEDMKVDGRQSRDFTFIKNVVDANIPASQSMLAPGRIYNVACGVQHSLLDLIQHLNQVLQLDITPFFDTARPGDVPHSLASIDRARLELGYDPAIDFESGLKLLHESL